MSGSTSLEAPSASPVDIGIMLEQIRCNHEEIERLEQMVMEDLKTEETSPMKQLLQGHRLGSMAKSIVLKSEKLIETYEKNGAIKDDIAWLRDQSGNWTNVSSAFSSRLQEILEYHQKHPSAPLVDPQVHLKEEPIITFTGEECFGRYLDLHDLYNQYININSSFGEKFDYSAYLDVFSQPEKISSELKPSREYTEYMEALLRYLICFFQRTQPLQDLDRILSMVEADLEDLFPSQPSVTDLDWCTQQQRAERLSLTEHAPLERKELLMEAKVKKLCSLLDETIARTKQNRGKNQALAFEELEGEEGQTESDSGDGYKSALKRSTGWDGKPIPYWLDQLGLGQEYKCQICSNHSYAGKRAFERHFKDWRHVCQLRRLGIPYTEKLNGIASIEEAKEVWMGMAKRPRFSRPVEADGNLGPLLARSQLTDQGIEGNSSNQAPGGAAVPPADIRSVLEKTVGILTKTGLETERKIIDVYGKVARFEFLDSRDPYHAFYKHRLAENRARATDGGAAAAAAKRSQPRYSITSKYVPAVFEKLAPLPFKPHRKFTLSVPEGITSKELDVIKLTAQFWALYGRGFWEGCSERKNKDSLFEFMEMPSPDDDRSYLFSGLLDAYLGVVSYSRPGGLKEMLREHPTSDMETVLENCFHRLQCDRLQKEHREKERQERVRVWEAMRPPRLPLPMKHLWEMQTMALDPPPKPDPRRPKIDESDQFLAQNPPGSVRV